MASTATSRDFHHPFTPYAIQNQFMNAVYDCLEDGKVGIFESPTGTGKSLSVICASMTWLRDHKRQAFEDGPGAHENDAGEPDWMITHELKQRRHAAIQSRRTRETRLALLREKEERARIRYEGGEPPHKRQKVASHDESSSQNEDMAFLLDDYESEDETRSQSKGRASEMSQMGLSADTQALMTKLGLYSAEAAPEDEDDMNDEIKIFFCSRTHSQLTQFVNELRRVKLPPSIEDKDQGPQLEKDRNTRLVEEIKQLTLGSRKNLCINPKVNKLGSTSAINERCLELQQAKTPSEAKCSFLPNKDNETLVHDFRDYALAKIRDIEDLGKLGKRVGICPYYASRAAISPSEIVTLPYPLMLQKSAREALGISLKDHVVIIDEAHNLMDAIAGIHSTSVSLRQLKQSRAQLGIYLQKFRNRLMGKNRVYVTQLVRLIDSLAGYLETKSMPKQAIEGQAMFSALLEGKGMDQVNLYKLMRYVQESRIARKVEGYLDHVGESSAKSAQSTSSDQRPRVMPVLTHIQAFLMALTNPDAEGRFFYSREGSDGSEEIYLRYLLLDPTQHFKEIVEEARAVVLAGGTMSPMNDYIDHLFHYIPLSRIQTLSCGHVIPPTNLLAMPVSRGPTGVNFDFTFEKRTSTAMLSELGRMVLQLANVVPDGLVVFFPSYSYLDTVVKHWQAAPIPVTSAAQTQWSQISARKRIFMEPKSSPSVDKHTSESKEAKLDTPDKLLTAYTSHVKLPSSSPDRRNGALLLAVIGGSLSEGINFSDELGRGIAVVGLPFPNARSAEWKARLEFVAKGSRRGVELAQQSVREGGVPVKKEVAGEAAAREYLENACMRAVNQSVGRAIRHKDDYAAIMLLDRRYERANIREKLPGWIKESLKCGLSFADVENSLTRFFKAKPRGGEHKD